MTTIGERIKEFAKEKYGSASALAKEMGVSPPALADYTRDISKPDAKIQERLRDAGADVEWIMTGEKRQTGQIGYSSPKILSSILYL